MGPASPADDSPEERSLLEGQLRELCAKAQLQLEDASVERTLNDRQMESPVARRQRLRVRRARDEKRRRLLRGDLARGRGGRPGGLRLPSLLCSSPLFTILFLLLPWCG